MFNVVALLHSNSESFVALPTSKIKTAFAKPKLLYTFYLFCMLISSTLFTSITCTNIASDLSLCLKRCQEVKPIDTCQHHLSPYKLPMLSPQYLHCISAPANCYKCGGSWVRSNDDYNQQGMIALIPMISQQQHQTNNDHA